MNWRKLEKDSSKVELEFSFSKGKDSNIAVGKRGNKIVPR